VKALSGINREDAKSAKNPRRKPRASPRNPVFIRSGEPQDHGNLV